MSENKIIVKLGVLKAINFAMHQNQVPVIYEFVIENISEEILKDVQVKISFSPEFAKEYSTTITEISPGQKIDLMPLKIVMMPNYLFELSEKIVGNINIEVSTQEKSVLKDSNSSEKYNISEETNISQDSNIFIKYMEIEVLPHDYWQGAFLMPEFIGAFIMPNLPKISEITGKAGMYLQHWKSDPSFTAYQTDDINDVKMQVAAIYAALQEENIAYIMSPPSFEKSGQRIRLPQEVLQYKQGTCIDLAVLFASCLEAVHIHSLIIIVKGHAFVGYWLENKTFPDAIIDDGSAINKRNTEGINEIGLLECTDFVAGKNVMIDMAEKHGREHLVNRDDFIVAIDLQRTRELGIFPMPVKIERDGCTEIIDFGKRSQEEITNIPKMLDTSLKNIHLTEKEMTRQQLWERKLLDMSLRNSLLSFRFSKNILQLMCGDLALIEDKLSDGHEFSILPRPIEWSTSIRDTKMFEIENNKDMVQNVVETEFRNGRIRTFLNDTELQQALKGLIRSSKSSLEENGTNTLYLALGFLKWYETEKSKKERYAPLIMIPITLVKKLGDKGYVIRLRDDEPQINITLLEFLRQNYGIHIPGLDPLPQDEFGIDIPLILKTIRQAIMNQPGWDVKDVAYIGLFSFSRFVMWNDIKNRSAELAQNKVVSSLISGKMEWDSQDMVCPTILDEMLAPSDMAIPASIDSSQLAAVVSASKGQSFVLHGPPGTGKSQTITNMIANALYQGKSVLFVAEKMAALSVVEKRLSKIGLGPFCLELHSNKSQKKNVLLQLEHTLDVGHTKRPEQYLETARKLHECRKELNEVVYQLHKKHPCGYSIYELVGLYEETIDYKGLIEIPSGNYAAVSKGELQNDKDIITRLVVAYEECGQEICNKFYIINKRTFYPDYKREVENALKQYDNALKHLELEMNEICSLFSINKKLSADSYKKMFDFIKKLEPIQWIFSNLIIENNDPFLVERVAKFIERGKRKKEIEIQMLEQFDKAVFSVDAQKTLLEWNAALSQSFIPKAFNQSKIYKLLKLYAKQPKLFTKDAVKSTLELLGEFQDLSKQITAEEPLIIKFLGTHWNGFDPQWNHLEEILNASIKLQDPIKAFTEEISTSIKNWITSENLQITAFKNKYKSFIASYQQYKEIYENLKQQHEISFDQNAHEKDWIQKNSDCCAFIIGNLDYLKSWISFMNMYDSAVNAGIGYVANAYLNEQLSGEILNDAFTNNMIYAIICSILNENAILCSFQGSQFEETISNYKEILNEFEILTIKELVAVLSEKIPNTTMGSAGSSEIGILQKAIKSGGRGMSVRKLFDAIPNLLHRLCPCMLMSPISVAQFIDPNFPKFDLVIFDEASQLPTSESVGAIARGENVVVVGDPKQLPPTSFFSSSHFDEEHIDKEDLESVLDDCLAISMPQQHLLWHYRSRHESLIAYSNMKYYENKLLTFPSPNDLISKVKYVWVDGFYDRSGTRQNQAEAEEIVKEMIRRLKSEELRKESIGVVTFSSVQQILIEDLLAEEFVKYPELEQINNELSEPIFIKNLENVQGDERDVILFSICYAGDKEGKISMNFGPINREGGWRRLNVAISRARKEMIVFATLKPEQIDLSRSQVDGVTGLKGFLEYAMHGKTTLAVRNNTVREKNTKLAKSIAHQINNRGFQTNFEIGYSDYRVDIGVINPDDPNHYVLGILIDGDNYNMSPTSRDRNISQFSVLSGLGWKLHYIWTIDWLDSPQKELDKIMIAIKEAIEQNDKEKPIIETFAKREIEFEKIENNLLAVDKTRIYEVCILDNYKHTVDFYNMENSHIIKKLIQRILEKEAPISLKLLTKRLMDCFGLTRISNKIELVVWQNIRLLPLKETTSNGQKFYWNINQIPDDYSIYRLPSEEVKRTMDDVCEQEVANAIYHIMENQCSLLEEDLIRETGKLFGFARMSGAVEESVKLGIDFAISKSLIERIKEEQRIQIKQ